MSEDRGKKSRHRKYSECVTRNEDLLVRVLSYSTARLLGRASYVNRFFYEMASHDSLWKDLTQKRWKGMRMEPEWLKDSKEDVKWVDMYRKSLRQIRRTLPVFAMHSRLRRGIGMGLNFFEPRYKWLSQRIKSENPETGSSRDEFDPDVFEYSNDQLFCFSTSHPSEGAIAWICRACHLNIRRDGGADFIALPLAKCVLKQVWTEEVPNAISGVGYRAPPLMVCVCEELPVHDGSRSERSEEERSETWGARIPDIIRRRHLGVDGERLMFLLANSLQGAGGMDLEQEDAMRVLNELMRLADNGVFDGEDDDEEEEGD